MKLQTSLSSLSVVLAIWKFACVLTATVSILWWGSKVWMEKFAKWWHHTLALYGLHSYLWSIHQIYWLQSPAFHCHIYEKRSVRTNEKNYLFILLFSQETKLYNFFRWEVPSHHRVCLNIVYPFVRLFIIPLLHFQ